MSEKFKIRPSYVAKFRCIGSECEDTCCKGWDVLLDKATYEKYQLIPVSSLRSVVNTQVELIKENASPSNYARVKLSENGNCPFLAEDDLCSVQKQYGEDYLSATCAIYPRVLNKVDGEMERSLYVSCPEAARLVLLEPDLLQAEGRDSSRASREDQFSNLDTDQEFAGRKPYQFFWEVRKLILSLIRNRTYPLWQRLFFLGMFCEGLEQCSRQEPGEQVPVILAEYTQMIERGQLREQLNSIDKHITTQLDFVMRAVDQRMRIGTESRRYMECVQEFLQGIQYNPNSTAEDDARHYTEAYRNYYEPFQQKHEYMLENFLANYVFKNLFPFGHPAGLHHEQRSISEEYSLLLAQFALIKGLLIGLAGQHRDNFAPEHVVKVIQSISKISEHSPAYLQGVLQLLEERNLKSAYGMAVLLRN